MESLLKSIPLLPAHSTASRREHSMPKPDADNQRDPKPANDQDQDQRKKDDPTETTEEELDETIDESFPASDPPANY